MTGTLRRSRRITCTVHSRFLTAGSGVRIVGPMFGGLVILMVFLAVGEFLAAVGVPLPGNVIGMILLSVALLSGRLSLSSVKKASDVLLDNLAFLFVPPGVGIMVHASLIADHWLPVAVAILVSTVLVTVTVGGLQELLSRSRRSAADGVTRPGGGTSRGGATNPGGAGGSDPRSENEESGDV